MLKGINKNVIEVSDTGNDCFERAILKISFFSKDGTLLGSEDVILRNLREGETVTIDEMTTGDIRAWASYSVRLEMGF